MSRNLVLGEGNPSYNGQTSDKLMKKYVSKQTTLNCTCDQKKHNTTTNYEASKNKHLLAHNAV